MSTHPPSDHADQHDGPTCGYCDGPRNPEASIKGSYCSWECFHRDTGEGALNQIETDHRYCGTCFRRIKDTWRPSEESLIQDYGVKWSIREVFIGFQAATEFGEGAVDVASEFKTDDVDDEPAPVVSNPREIGRLGCVCGDVDGRAQDVTIREVEGEAALAAHLLACLEELADQGAITSTPDAVVFADALAGESADWPYVVGRALNA